MTASGQQLAVLAQQQISDATALEDQTTTQADGGAGGALTVLVTAALAGWVATFGALTAAGSGLALARYLAGVRQDAAKATAGLDTRASAVIEARLGEAAQMGARHAVEFAARAAGGHPHAPHASIPADALHAVRALAGTVREQLRLSQRLLADGEVRRAGWRGVLAGIGAARRAVALAGQAAAWSIHRAVNAGAAQAIAALDARGLWVTEPDACVRCLAYAGRLADPDGTFPGGLSLDPRQHAAHAGRLESPPLHPHCRCRLVPWRDEWAPLRGLALPDLLQQQAWRSVASGRGRPSESRAARLRAARMLLARRGVPAPVRDQARSAVAAGHF